MNDQQMHNNNGYPVPGTPQRGGGIPQQGNFPGTFLQPMPQFPPPGYYQNPMPQYSPNQMAMSPGYQYGSYGSSPMAQMMHPPSSINQFRVPQVPQPRDPPAVTPNQEIVLDSTKQEVDDPFVKNEVVSEEQRLEASSPFVESVSRPVPPQPREVEDSVLEVAVPAKGPQEVVDLSSTIGRQSAMGESRDFSIVSTVPTPMPTIEKPDNAAAITNMTMTDQEPQSDDEEIDVISAPASEPAFRSDREYHRIDSDGEVEEVESVKTRISGTSLPGRFLSGLRLRINDFRKTGQRKAICRYKSSVENKVCGREFRIPRNRIPMVRHQIANIRPHVLYHFKKPFYKCDRCGESFRRIKEHTTNEHFGSKPMCTVQLSENHTQKLIDLVDECFPPLHVEPEMVYLDEDEDYNDSLELSSPTKKRNRSRVSEAGSQTEKNKNRGASVLNTTDEHIEEGSDGDEDNDEDLRFDDTIFNQKGPRQSTPVPVLSIDNVSAILPATGTPKEFLNLCRQLTEQAHRKGIDEIICQIEDCPDDAKIVNAESSQCLQKHIIGHGKGAFRCQRCNTVFSSPKKPAHRCGGFKNPLIDDWRGENIPLIWKCFGKYLQN